jgi:hypothetical protein
MSAPDSFILWEGSSHWDGSPIVAIATGVNGTSANRKTGRMVQVFIIRADVHPVEALASGQDSAICGACPLRGVGGRERVCYVEVGKSPAAVWRAYRAGSYVRARPGDARRWLAGRAVRLGAYGDPAMLPYRVVADAVADARAVTGYTHQWRTVARSFSRFLMASVDDARDLPVARGKGWRSFVVVAPGRELPTRTVECMAVRERNPRQCVDCLACGGTRNGTRIGAVDIAIHAHGAGAQRMAGLQN